LANFARKYSLEKISAPMYGSAQRRIARALSLGIAERCSGTVAEKPREANKMSIGMIVLVILVLALVGVIPSWPYSTGWGYGPSGGVGLILAIVLILFLLGKI
jgi:hypothetical protein